VCIAKNEAATQQCGGSVASSSAVINQPPPEHMLRFARGQYSSSAAEGLISRARHPAAVTVGPRSRGEREKLHYSK
jgi:hypothetical protein